MAPAPKDPEKYKQFIKNVGESSKGRKHTEEHKIKMSKKFSGENNPFFGKKHTKASLIKMSVAHKNMTEETKKKISKSISGENHPNYGKHHSEETRNRIRIANSKERNYNYGNSLSDEWKKKISNALKGRVKLKEERIKLAIAQTGKKYTLESRKKMSEKHKGLQAREKHPNWKGGVTEISTLIRGSKEYDNWRDSVFKRDNYCDQFSGIKGNGNLNAHHIVSLCNLIENNNIRSFDDALKCPEIWDINNGITMFETTHVAYHQMREPVRKGGNT